MLKMSETWDKKESQNFESLTGILWTHENPAEGGKQILHWAKLSCRTKKTFPTELLYTRRKILRTVRWTMFFYCTKREANSLENMVPYYWCTLRIATTYCQYRLLRRVTPRFNYQSTFKANGLSCVVIIFLVGDLCYILLYIIFVSNTVAFNATSHL